LLREEIQMNSHDDEGVSILMFATLEGNMEILHLLLGHEDVQVNLRDDEGRTAILYAKEAEPLRAFLKRGDVDWSVSDGAESPCFARRFLKENAMASLILVANPRLPEEVYRFCISPFLPQ